jgi:hypothetical protein
MYEWYYVWQMNPYKWHKAEYCNTHLRCLVWINGSELNQQEKVEGLVRDFGVENSGCPQIIKYTIANCVVCK